MTADALPFDTLQALASTGWTLYIATLSGEPSPIVKAVATWMKAPPRAGDLMLEISTWRRLRPGVIGLFERDEKRDVCEHEDEDPNLDACTACGPDDRYHEQYTWLITGVQGRDPVWRHRWHDAEFIRIPKNAADHHEARHFLDIPRSESERRTEREP